MENFTKGLTPQAKLDTWLKAKTDRYAKIQTTHNGSGRDYYEVTIYDPTTMINQASHGYDRDDAIATALIDFARFEEPVPAPAPATAQERLDAWLAGDVNRRAGITENIDCVGTTWSVQLREIDQVYGWAPICRGASKEEAIERALEKAKERGY